jgi:hypothetical protein
MSCKPLKIVFETCSNNGPDLRSQGLYILFVSYFVHRDLEQRGIRVRVGMEATVFALVRATAAELGFEVWIGDPAVIKTSQEAEDRPRGRPTPAATDAGR